MNEVLLGVWVGLSIFGFSVGWLGYIMSNLREKTKVILKTICIISAFSIFLFIASNYESDYDSGDCRDTYVIESDDKIITCKEIRLDSCGADLFMCSDDNYYYCVQNVKQVRCLRS